MLSIRVASDGSVSVRFAYHPDLPLRYAVCRERVTAITNGVIFLLSDDIGDCQWFRLQLMGDKPSKLDLAIDPKNPLKASVRLRFRGAEAVGNPVVVEDEAPPDLPDLRTAERMGVVRWADWMAGHAWRVGWEGRKILLGRVSRIRISDSVFAVSRLAWAGEWDEGVELWRYGLPSGQPISTSRRMLHIPQISPLEGGEVVWDRKGKMMLFCFILKRGLPEPYDLIRKVAVAVLEFENQ